MQRDEQCDMNGNVKCDNAWHVQSLKVQRLRKTRGLKKNGTI